MKKKVIIGILIYVQLIFVGMLVCTSSTNTTNMNNYSPMQNLKTSGGEFSNVTILSDGYNNVWGWNMNPDSSPSMISDSLGNIHVVWSGSSPGIWGGGSEDNEIFYTNYTAATRKWANVTLISDGYNNEWGWNTNQSYSPEIAVDNANNLHVVWYDNTPGFWGGGEYDYEIMYVKYTASTSQWSNASVISDGYHDVFGWNKNGSYSPDIAIDSLNNLHVVWHDATPGIWEGGLNDLEIMYVNYSVSSGEWSNATVISDGYNDDWGWNNGKSGGAKIVIDSQNNLHVLWQDDTTGVWGGGEDDEEIMYANYSSTTGQWSNATIISDGYGGIWGWDGSSDSLRVSVCVDNSDNLHAVWEDGANGKWGDDREIMYANSSAYSGQWSNITVISDGYNNIWDWNDETSWAPSIDVDSHDNLHVVWTDDTDGIWGSDEELMYVKYNNETGWSNVTIVSDGYKDIYGWNNHQDRSPELIIDMLDNVHIAWTGYTANMDKWGSDPEIWYSTTFKPAVAFISGGGNGNGNGKSDDSILPVIILVGIIAAIGITIVIVILMKKRKK